MSERDLRIEKALTDAWHKWGGYPAVESGMVNMVGVLADVARGFVAEERERCAKVAEMAVVPVHPLGIALPAEIAAAIRNPSP